jgi:hypothetical protein
MKALGKDKNFIELSLIILKTFILKCFYVSYNLEVKLWDIANKDKIINEMRERQNQQS